MLRIVIVSFREFAIDRCALRASALTFYSLLSIVPVFAMAFGIAKGFGADKALKNRLIENMAGQEEVITRVISFAETLLDNAKGGVIAGIGILLLFWTVIKVLGHIESSFNAIWGLTKERSLGRKFSDYLSLMLICPALLILSSGATVFITSQITLVTAKLSFLGAVAPVILWGLSFLPYCVLWGLLTYIYMFMPNGKIQFKSALIGGVIGGTIYQVVQKLYIHFQVGVGNAGAIYGSFAALPLFLMWLQLSWLIVLYGAELSFAHQNEETFEFEPDCLRISEHMKKVLSLRITHRCIERFCRREGPQTAAQMGDELEIPIRLMRQTLSRLTEAGVLSTVTSNGDRELAYQPARDVDGLTVKSVMDSLEQHGFNEISFGQSPELQEIKGVLAAFGAVIDQLPANVALKSINAGARPAAVR